MSQSDTALRDRFFTPERRLFVPISNLEWRESGSGDGSRIFTGYAAVYETPAVLYQDDRYRLVETIARGAFDNVLRTKPDVHLVINHDMSRAIARTNITGMGSLKLSSDRHGLSVHAKLNPDDPDVQALASKVSIGIVTQMSFSFSLREQDQRFEVVRTLEGVTEERRLILNVSELFDVSACARGAYDTTSAALRSREAAEPTSPAAVLALQAQAALIERTML